MFSCQRVCWIQVHNCFFQVPSNKRHVTHIFVYECFSAFMAGNLFFRCSCLNFDTMQIWRLTATFYTNMLHPSSGLKKLVYLSLHPEDRGTTFLQNVTVNLQTTWCQNWVDCNLMFSFINTNGYLFSGFSSWIRCCSKITSNTTAAISTEAELCIIHAIYIYKI